MELVSTYFGAIKKKFEDIKFIVIDEASMLGLNLFPEVHKRLGEAKLLWHYHLLIYHSEGYEFI